MTIPTLVDRQSLPERVATRLHGLIADGSYPPGSQLPHQRDLAKQFGVSTAVIRESLALLAAGGVVWSRSGQGTFVADRPAAVLRFPMWIGEPADDAEIVEATEARDVLEHAITRLAAARRTKKDVARLRACVTQMEDAVTDSERFAAADLQFHLVLAEVARNRPLSSALASLRQLIERDIVVRAGEQIASGTLERAVANHARVVDAVERGDADAAEAQMAEILEHALQSARRGKRARGTRRRTGGQA